MVCNLLSLSRPKTFTHICTKKSVSQYIDKNYGNLLIIWDRMFGTFEPEKESVKYGLVNNVNTFNPTKITFMGWQQIFKDMMEAKNINEAMYFFFGPPKTKHKL